MLLEDDGETSNCTEDVANPKIQNPKSKSESNCVSKSHVTWEALRAFHIHEAGLWKTALHNCYRNELKHHSYFSGAIIIVRVNIRDWFPRRCTCYEFLLTCNTNRVHQGLVVGS